MLKLAFSQNIIDKHILSNIIILVDTREQQNQHILDYLDKKEIKWKLRTLDFGDYQIMLCKNDEYGFPYDLIPDYAVERKAHLEELSGNFTKGRTNLEEEMWRSDGKMDFVIEKGSLDDIMRGNYDTNYIKKSFIVSLSTFRHRYGTSFNFSSKEFSPQMIFALLFYRLREELK
jgi:hypothetical protein